MSAVHPAAEKKKTDGVRGKILQSRVQARRGRGEEGCMAACVAERKQVALCLFFTYSSVWHIPTHLHALKITHTMLGEAETRVSAHQRGCRGFEWPACCST